VTCETPLFQHAQGDNLDYEEMLLMETIKEEEEEEKSDE